MSSSVLSKNPFSLLAEDAEEVPAHAPKKEERKVAEPKQVDNSRARPQEARLKRDYPQRGGFRGVPVGGRASAPRSFSSDNSAFVGSPESERVERGGFRGRGRGRGRGGRGRDFDRRSGADRKDGPKKDVAGKGSWGESTENPEDAAKETVEVEAAEKKAGDAPVEEKEEEKIKTLDEYLAELTAKKAALNSANIRKANEGADETQWKDAIPLQKQDVDENDELAAFIYGSNRGEKNKIKKTERTQKVHLDIEQKFADDEKSRGGFRGRGRGGHRGGNRGGRVGNGGNKQQAVNINDTCAFPTLGGN